MRNLVTLRTIQEIRDIPNADKVQLALIDGWQCVVKKGEFKVGDQGLFHEIDSVLPADDPRYAFMAPRFRVKTVRLRKTLSQGLLLPVSVLTNDEQAQCAAGVPLDQILKVTKFEIPLTINQRGEMAGSFPGFIPKTDQERIQNIPEVLEGRRITDFEITEKLDGSSFTAWYFHADTGCPATEEQKAAAVGLASRNYAIKPDKPCWYSHVYAKYDLGRKLTEMGRNIALQGEIIGPGIQGNKYGLKELDLYIFDIYDIDARRYMDDGERHAITQQLGLNHVPRIPVTSTNLLGKPLTVQDVLQAADGPSAVNPQTMREGLVFKGPSRFKAISNSWLLLNED